MDPSAPQYPPLNEEHRTELAAVLARHGHPDIEVRLDPATDEKPEQLRCIVPGAELVFACAREHGWSWDVDPHEGRQQGTYDDSIGGGGSMASSLDESVTAALKYAADLRP